jgi:8-oxo-dGTP pyrophosphatase MutT (NUDIX family)
MLLPASRERVAETLRSYRCRAQRDAQVRDATMEFLRTAQDPFGSQPFSDHFTGSAFVLNRSRTHVLLTKHKKLRQWLQLGGHCDGVADPSFVALREAYEESGLSHIEMATEEIFDLDIQFIPEIGRDPAHRHYDARFIMLADMEDELRATEESSELAWVSLTELHDYTQNPSVLLVREKLPAFVA